MAPELPKLKEERETERALAEEWFGLPDDARKKAYDADSLPIPEALAAKPLTAKYKAGTAAKVKSLLTDRCVVCHSPGGERETNPLENYEQFKKYFGPPPADQAAPKADDKIPPAGD
jgi:mono/diheme cytochrome c family protein